MKYILWKEKNNDNRTKAVNFEVIYQGDFSQCAGILQSRTPKGRTLDFMVKYGGYLILPAKQNPAKYDPIDNI